MPSLTLAAGALVAQTCFLLILVVGLLLLETPHSQRLGQFPLRIPSGHTVLLSVAVLSLAVLALSDSIRASWGPLTGDLTPASVPDSTAMTFLFLADIVGVSLLVAGTGGSQSSPFQATFFLVPTLALFLREPLGRTVLYAAFAGLCFSLFMPSKYGSRDDRTPANRLSYWFVSVASLALTVYIGLATRPR